MRRHGQILMTEQSAPACWCVNAAAAERAGFTVVAVAQIDDEGQEDLLRFAESDPLPALRG